MAIDLTTGKGEKSKYNVERIRDAFETYDMIITTDIETIDTSKYNMCASLRTGNVILASMMEPSSGHRIITFGNNPKGAKQINSNNDSDWILVRIYERSIRNVIIKGKRNFMHNNPEGKKFE